MSSIPDYTNIVVKTLTEVDMLLKSFVFDGYSSLVSYLKMPLIAASTLFVAFFFYRIMAGYEELKTKSVMSLIMKLGFVTLAMDWGWVSHYFFGFINDIIKGMGDALISATPLKIPGTDGIDGAMQITLIEFTKLGSKLFNTGGLSNMGPYLDGILLWAFGYIVVGVGIAEIVIAKVMLAILFVFTPFMAILTYFKPFQTTFDRWLSAIIGFALLQLFVTAAIAFATTLGYWWIGERVLQRAVDIGNYGTLPILLLSIICVFILLKAASLAQNLGGMASSDSAGAFMGGMMGSALGMAIASPGKAFAFGKGAYKFHKAYKAAQKKLGDKLGGVIKSALRRGD